MAVVRTLDPISNRIPEVDVCLQEDNSAVGKTQTNPHPNLQPVLEQAVISNQSWHHRTKHSNKETPRFEADGVIKKDQEQGSSQAITEKPVEMSQSGLNQSVNSSILLTFPEQTSHFFSRYIDNINDASIRQKQCVQNITRKIKGQIKKGILKISEQPQHLSLSTAKKTVKYSKMKEELEHKKCEILQELRDIQDKEISLIRESREKGSSDRQRQRYILTHQDKQRIAELLRAKNNFEQDLTRKNKELLEQAKNNRQQQQKKQLELYDLENAEKRKKIELKIKQIEKQDKERKERLKNSILRRTEKYRYLRYQEEWDKKESQELSEQHQKLEQLRMQHLLDIQQINKHDKIYSLSLENRSKSPKSLEASRLSLPKREKTQFDRLIQQQLFQLKEQNYKKNVKLYEHEFRQKINRFKQKVDQSHRPKVDPSLKIVIPIQRAYSTSCLTSEERFEKGLQYLEKAKKMKQSYQTVQPKKIAPSPVAGCKQYKNYQTERQPPPFNPLKRQFRSIISSQKDTKDYDSVLRAKYLADGLAVAAKKGTDSQLYFSMRNKLKLLENLY